jgi:cell division protein FtsN
VRQYEVSTYWEDVEEEGSRDETEENSDDDDRREDDRELFIKGDGFEDVSEDTAEEEVMKQAEVPKNREGIKKELNSGFDISDDPGTMSGRVLETKPEVDKEEGFEDTTKDTDEVDKDAVKQNKDFFNREEVPEARTVVTRKSDSRHTKNWRLKELTPMLLLILLHLLLGNHNKVMKKNNPIETRVHQDRVLTRYGKPEMRDRMLDMYEARAVMIDTNIADTEFFILLPRAKNGNLPASAKFLQFPPLFSMIFYVITA